MPNAWVTSYPPYEMDRNVTVGCVTRYAPLKIIRFHVGLTMKRHIGLPMKRVGNKNAWVTSYPPYEMNRNVTVKDHWTRTIC